MPFCTTVILMHGRNHHNTQELRSGHVQTLHLKGCKSIAVYKNSDWILREVFLYRKKHVFY